MAGHQGPLTQEDCDKAIEVRGVVVRHVPTDSVGVLPTGSPTPPDCLRLLDFGEVKHD